MSFQLHFKLICREKSGGNKKEIEGHVDFTYDFETQEYHLVRNNNLLGFENQLQRKSAITLSSFKSSYFPWQIQVYSLNQRNEDFEKEIAAGKEEWLQIKLGDTLKTIDRSKLFYIVTTITEVADYITKSPPDRKFPKFGSNKEEIQRMKPLIEYEEAIELVIATFMRAYSLSIAEEEGVDVEEALEEANVQFWTKHIEEIANKVLSLSVATENKKKENIKNIKQRKLEQEERNRTVEEGGIGQEEEEEEEEEGEGEGEEEEEDDDFVAAEKRREYAAFEKLLDEAEKEKEKKKKEEELKKKKEEEEKKRNKKS